MVGQELSYSVCCPHDILTCYDEMLNGSSSEGYLNYTGGLTFIGSVHHDHHLATIQSNLSHFLNEGILGPDDLVDCHSQNIGYHPKTGDVLRTDALLVRIRLFANWIGRGRLTLNLKVNDTVASSKLFNVLVLPPASKFGLMPTLGLFVGFSVNIFGFALTVDKNDAIPFLKRPVELLFIVCEQYLFFPLLAWLINTILNQGEIFQFILLSMSSSSAGAITNLCCLLTRGRLNLNVISLVVTPYLGLIAMPLWACTLGIGILKKEFPDHEITFPWLQFLALKLLFILPGVLSMLFKLWIPSRTRTISLIIRPLALVWVTIMLILLVVDIHWTLYYAVDWRVSLGPVMLTIIGGIVFLPSSYLVTRDSKTSLTITMQGIMANPSYAILFCVTMVPKPFTAIPICSTAIYFVTVISIGLTTTMITRLRHHSCDKEEVNIAFSDGQVTTNVGSEPNEPSIKLETFHGGSVDEEVGDGQGCLMRKLLSMIS